MVWMEYSLFLTSVVVFRPYPPWDGSRAGQNWSGGPFFRKRPLQTARLQQQIDCIAMIKIQVERSFAIFVSIPKSGSLTRVQYPKCAYGRYKMVYTS